MPQPRSSTASATAPGSHQTRTMIGVPGSLYLHAFSIRLSSNWPSSGRCAWVQSGVRLAPLETQVGRPLVFGPGADLFGGPGGEVKAFKVWQPGLGFGPGEEQERLDDPPEPDGVVVKPVQDALMLKDGAWAAAGDLDRGDQGGKRRAELVRCLAGELLLPL